MAVDPPIARYLPCSKTRWGAVPRTLHLGYAHNITGFKSDKNGLLILLGPFGAKVEPSSWHRIDSGQNIADG
jgi:hypothetical protein